MTEQTQVEIPRRILLATDLSARCDRALDRAAQLATEWKAHLVVVHALEWDFQEVLREGPNTPSWRRDATRRMAIASEQIHDDLLDRRVPFDVVIEEGEPTEIVLKAAETHGCDLIVTGIARSETFGRLVLGTTVERLARRAKAPTLVVKSRAKEPYRKIAVGTDFSDASRHALERTARMFPQAALVLMHSYWPILGTLEKDAAVQAAAQKTASEDCARFLAGAALSEQSRAGLQTVVESGAIESVVTAYARDKGLDLLAIGARGRNPILDLLLGSTAERLLNAAPCDVLIIRKT
jgi:nucleotide-binding universal stress UspA family protein